MPEYKRAINIFAALSTLIFITAQVSTASDNIKEDKSVD